METSAKKRKSYTVAFKLEVVDYARKTSREAAARHFAVDGKRIREWCKTDQQLSLLADGDKKRQRLDGWGEIA